MQDLTPQLRTRLSRMERTVGWFVLLGAMLLVAGFAYYFYVTAQRKGWFQHKVPYYTYVEDATGLKVGDPVRMMGFDVGEITQIQPTPAADYWYVMNHYNVFVNFRIREPYYGYIWTDSKTKIITGDFLGKRVMEVTKGQSGEVSVILSKDGAPVAILNDDPGQTNLDYVLLTKQPKGYWLRSVESPALTERFDQIADRVEQALPGFFAMTNRLHEALTHADSLLTNMDAVAESLRPVGTNVTRITAMLTNSEGGLGNWLIPTNISGPLAASLETANATLGQADNTLVSAQTNLANVAEELRSTLENVSAITGNFRHQVETNDHILSVISDAVIHLDEMVQGLKHHWLFRSAFKNDEDKKKEPAPPAVIRRGKRWWE